MNTMRLPLVHGSRVFLTSDIRRIENGIVIAAGTLPLMERAGAAAADFAQALCPDRSGPVVIFVGPGNNGGDALVVARILRERWFDVCVVSTTDPSRYPPDAALAWKAWREAGGDVVTSPPPVSSWRLSIDGIFGIGLQRDVSGPYTDWISLFNQFEGPRIALDIPSGLSSDTGRVLGCAIRATHTLTFIGLKPGLLTLDGPDHSGAIEVADLDLDLTAFASNGTLLGEACVGDLLRPRRGNSHKGTFGSVGIIGGARGMVGAALLAGRAALLTGAGRVYCGLLDDDSIRVDPAQPELMLGPVSELMSLPQITCLAAGPGLGTSAKARELIERAIATDLPLVLDADALNLLAAHPHLMGQVAQRSAPTILTPHPAEASRLLSCTTADVQNDRVAAALRLAETMGCGVVLKGAGSVCAVPDGRWHINTTGNPGMAAAGMGDVLTGIIAALLSQNVSAYDALTGGVCLHGAAADHAVAQGRGPVGLTATEVAQSARTLLNRRP